MITEYYYSGNRSTANDPKRGSGHKFVGAFAVGECAANASNARALREEFHRATARRTESAVRDSVSRLRRGTEYITRHSADWAIELIVSSINNQ